MACRAAHTLLRTSRRQEIYITSGKIQRWLHSSASTRKNSNKEFNLDLDKKLDGLLAEEDQARPKFGFAFDIDGVLIRGGKALPRAGETLRYLSKHKIPYMLLTNGGGVTEEEKTSGLNELLKTQMKAEQVVQSHTPFRELDEYKNSTVLVVGGMRGGSRDAAKEYGFKNIVTPSDIITACPHIWHFSAKAFKQYYATAGNARPLPKPIDPTNPTKSLKIDAIFVYNDPRDWSLDATIIIDCLLSKNGVLGTLSEKNGDRSLPNKGYQQDGQPPIYFSNPDLWFAAEFALPRLGQGGFKAALDGLWAAITGPGVELKKTVIGKPHKATYEFAEKHMIKQNKDNLLNQVYMVGDNPESDIRGANDFESQVGTKWKSILLRSGVYNGGKPAVEPTTIQDDVYNAVWWALDDAGWKEPSPPKPSTADNSAPPQGSPRRRIAKLWARVGLTRYELQLAQGAIAGLGGIRGITANDKAKKSPVRSLQDLTQAEKMQRIMLSAKFELLELASKDTHDSILEFSALGLQRVQEASQS